MHIRVRKDLELTFNTLKFYVLSKQGDQMKFTVHDAKVTAPVDADIEDESVLADGMTPDSRLVKLIDELGIISNDFKNDGNLNKECIRISLGLC